MCTLTWWSSPESGADYEVFFNRDEMKSRPVAAPPEVVEKGGVRFLSPRDPLAGGTWVLVNEFGITFALLNWYSREVKNGPGQKKKSRGELVLDLGDVRSAGELVERLSVFDPGDFQPFRLLVFFPAETGSAVDYWQWSGAGEFEQAECPSMPICSSSFDRESVIRAREADLAKVASSGPDGLWNFHHNGDSSETSAYTVRMNRPDAQTWSISRITVQADRVRFLYEAESRDLEGDPESFESSMKRIFTQRV